MVAGLGISRADLRAPTAKIESPAATAVAADLIAIFKANPIRDAGGIRLSDAPGLLSFSEAELFTLKAFDDVVLRLRSLEGYVDIAMTPLVANALGKWLAARVPEAPPKTAATPTVGGPGVQVSHAAIGD
jgi:hypothetical protein